MYKSNEDSCVLRNVYMYLSSYKSWFWYSEMVLKVEFLEEISNMDYCLKGSIIMAMI